MPIRPCSDDMEKENSWSARRAFDSEAPRDKWRRFTEREDFFTRVSVFHEIIFSGLKIASPLLEQTAMAGRIRLHHGYSWSAH